MKLKFICHSQRSIWLKKLISKSLAIGLLFNGGLTSFAGTLSEDSRHERFEGNNITIDNVLEEDKIDAEIEGNTLVNLLGSQGSSIYLHDNSQTTRKRYFKNINLKPYTTYTLITNISNLSSSDNSELKVHYILINKDGTTEEVYPNNFKCTLSNGQKKIVFTTKSTSSNATDFYLYVDALGNYYGTSNQFSFESSKCMLLEGDWTNKETPDCFEGMKSVGELEDNKINIEVLGENLFDVEYFKEMIETHYNEGNYRYELKDGRNTIWVTDNHDRLHLENILSNNYKFKENTQYIIKGDIFVDKDNPTGNNMLRGDILYTDKTTQRIFDYKGITDKWVTSDIITDKGKTIESIYFTYGSKLPKGWFDLDSLYIGEYNLDKTEFNYDYNVQNIEVDLKEPLRGLPNGVKDRIIKRNGQWFIERNCWGGIITGDEVFYDGYPSWSNTVFGVSIDYPTKKNARTLMWNSDTVMPRTVNELVFNDVKGFAIWDYNGFKAFVDVGKETKEETKSYIKDNPIKYVYELETPIYEPLNIDSTINLYLNTTHVSNNSTIPANMKITIDRTLNRAIEAIELAKSNPTIENLSKARMWSNLLKESIEKDELQNEINNITNIDDLQIEKNNITSNMDVYIKPQNSLSMTLSTNSIIFEEFSGVENMEKLNAVDITISSSLPYQLNSYLESEIKNSDGSKIIPKELLNIRLNGENDYKAFSNINEKLVLKENCLKGNDNQFSVDLILKGDLTHRADIYKTVIKFEAEQK